MTTLHMETEQVRQAANRLGNTAAQMLTTASTLRSTAGRLSIAWQGGRAEGYQQSLSNLIRGYENQLQSLEGLAARVSREVDEWEEAATHFGPGDNWLKTVSKVVTDISNIAGGISGGIDLGAKTAIILGMAGGTAYGGEVILYGSQNLKEMAGLSSHLTHIKATNIPEHLLKQSKKIGPLEIGLAGLDFADRGIQDWAKYDKGSERATAIALDGLFVFAKTIGSHYAGYAAAVGVTALLTTVGAPVVLVGAAGMVAWWAGSQIFNSLANGAFDSVKDTLVHAGSSAIDAAASGIGSAAQVAGQAVDRAFGSVISGITSLF